MAPPRFPGGAAPLSDEELFAPRMPRPAPQSARAEPQGIEGQDWYRYLLGKLGEAPDAPASASAAQPRPYTWAEASARLQGQPTGQDSAPTAPAVPPAQSEIATQIQARSAAAYADQEEQATRRAAIERALSFGQYKGVPRDQAYTGQFAGMGTAPKTPPTPPQPMPGADGSQGFPGAEPDKDAERRKDFGAQLFSSSLGRMFQPTVPSDERVKRNVRAAPPSEQDATARSLEGYTFDYDRDLVASGAPADRRVGVMAGDVASTPLGREVVRETPQGKALDRDNALGLALGLIGRMGERIDKLEGKR